MSTEGGSAVAISHVKEEYMSGALTGSKSVDARIWESVVNLLAKDTRIEKSKHDFGHTTREAWMWTAAPLRDQSAYF